MDIIAFKHQPSGQFTIASKKVRCHTPMDGMGADLVVYSISLCGSATLGINIPSQAFFGSTGEAGCCTRLDAKTMDRYEELSQVQV